MDKVRTGIDGLDYVLQGGIVRGNVVLLQGTPGAGKTTLGLCFVYAGAKFYDEPGLVITFEEFPQQLYRDALQIGMDLQALEQENKLRVICTSPTVFREQLQTSDGLFQQLTREIGAKRIFVDSLTHFHRIAADPIELRDLVNGFLNALRQNEYTAFMTQEIDHEETPSIPFEQYIVDTVIRIFFTSVKGLQRKRFVEVLKARGQGFTSGKHSVKISEQGMQVFPRPIPQPSLTAADTGEPPAAAAVERAPTGVDGLDRMMGGGLIAGFSTLVAGDAGTGKTNLSLHFLSAGVRQGGRGLLVSLRDDLTKIVKSAASIGVDLRSAIDQGMLTVITRSPVNLEPDELFWMLKAELEKQDAPQYVRIVLDSLTDIEPAIDDENRFRDYVYSLVDLFESHNITSIMTRQAAEASAERELVEADLSMVFDAIITLRLRRIQDHIRKTMCLLKMRGSDHDSGVRQFKITDEGIVVETKFEGGSQFMRKLAKA